MAAPDAPALVPPAPAAHAAPGEAGASPNGGGWARHARTEVIPVIRDDRPPVTALDPVADEAIAVAVAHVEAAADGPAGGGPVEPTPAVAGPTEAPAAAEPTEAEPVDAEPVDAEPTDPETVAAAGTRAADLDVDPDQAEQISADPFAALFGQPIPPRIGDVNQRTTAELPLALRNADSVARLYASGSGAGNDTWDGRYKGRRRARIRDLRFWLVAVVVLGAIGAAIAVPLSKVPPTQRGLGGAAASEPGPGAVPFGPLDTSPSPDPTVTPSPTASRSPTASPSASPTPSPTASPTPSPTPSPTLPPTTPPPTTPPRTTPPPTTPPPFALNIEAEAAARSSGTQLVSNVPGASGGQIVQRMGTYGSPPGTLTFTFTAPTAGNYTLTITYMHPDGETPRFAIITVNGSNLPEVTFSGSSTCCSTKAMTVSLRAGSNTIVLGHPTKHAPAIDKIRITRP